MTNVNINGQVTTNNELTDEQVDKLVNIRNGFEKPTFKVSNKTEIAFRNNSYMSLAPLRDYFLIPLEELMVYAKDQGIILNGKFFLKSDCSDYDNLVIRIDDNDLSTLNANIFVASVKDLVLELSTRDRDEVLRELVEQGIIKEVKKQ